MDTVVCSGCGKKLCRCMKSVPTAKRLCTDCKRYQRKHTRETKKDPNPNFVLAYN